MSFDRRSAHAALTRATMLDRLEFETVAHDVVESLCDVIDAVGKEAAAQELQHQHYIRRLPPPSRETEAEKLQARRVKALEAIALALTAIAKKDAP
jgi:hypothetical protein